MRVQVCGCACASVCASVFVRGLPLSRWMLCVADQIVLCPVSARVSLRVSERALLKHDCFCRLHWRLNVHAAVCVRVEHAKQRQVSNARETY